MEITKKSINKKEYIDADMHTHTQTDRWWLNTMYNWNANGCGNKKKTQTSLAQNVKKNIIAVQQQAAISRQTINNY